MGVVELLGLDACKDLPTGELLHGHLANLVSQGSGELKKVPLSVISVVAWTERI